MIYVAFAVTHLSRTYRTHHKSRRALIHSPTARRND